MTARLRLAGLVTFAALVAAATAAGSAAAHRVVALRHAPGASRPSTSPPKAAKTVLVLKAFDEGKKLGETIKDGATVRAGWFIGFEPGPYEHVLCQVLPQTEAEEGSMVLDTNSTTKDIAKGSVAPPPCGEVEEYEEHGERRNRLKPVEDVSLSGGSMTEQEMTTKHTGTVDLSSALVLRLESKGVKCVYDSKTKIKGTWPPTYTTEEPEKKNEEEAFPFLEDTANIVAGVSLKLDSSLSAKTGCAKSEAVGMEVWLGPLGAELEAELP
ncbi:MAG TPA: hypothetical protein VMA83_00100 [Solirubrobacteraceae bacterium]|nr:hypothetical protein [Solirubrobacteraceae bacterium]